MSKKQIALTVGFAVFVIVGALLVAMAGGVVWGTSSAGLIAGIAFLIALVLAPIFGATFGD